MKQANSIKTLEKILRKAVEQEGDITGGQALTAAMDLEYKAYQLFNFFEIFSKAKKDVEKLKSIENIEEDIETITSLQDFFIANDIWKNKWDIFKKTIKTRNVLSILKSLAKNFSDENPKFFLDNEFIQSLRSEISELTEKIATSDLTEKLRDFLVEKFEEILFAIDEHDLYGVEKIETTVQTTLWKIFKEIKSIAEKDKESPVWKKSLSVLLSLESLLSLGIMTKTYLLPTFAEYTQNRDKVEKMLTQKVDLSNIPDSINNFKGLPPAKTERSESDESYES
ncbi:hypothetical protein [Sphaerothrix gracilis]|uniref:hypothetical protein n=1 Tax=Sphaerothrix gracilis TaxID=3151835 RepID=UPI0031FD335C